MPLPLRPPSLLDLFLFRFSQLTPTGTITSVCVTSPRLAPSLWIKSVGSTCGNDRKGSFEEPVRNPLGMKCGDSRLDVSPLIIDTMTSCRNRTLLLVDGFKFRYRSKNKDGVVLWSCVHHRCRCFVKLDYADRVVESLTDHNHPKPDEKKLARQKICNDLKRIAKEDVVSKPSTLLQAELDGKDVESLSPSDLALIKKNLHRARASLRHKFQESDYINRGRSADMRTPPSPCFYFPPCRKKFRGFSLTIHNFNYIWI